MSQFASFAVAGAGPTIGVYIVKALLEYNVRVLVLSRPSSSRGNDLPEHANLTVALVEYTDVHAVASLLSLHKVDALISAVSFAGHAAQTPLADAAKQAGVKLFVPSEFGIPTGGGAEGVAFIKTQFAAYLQSIDLPCLRLYNGVFHKFIPFFAAVPDTGKFHIVGEGKSPVSFTSPVDVAGFLAHILVTLKHTQFYNIELRIEGERLTLSEVAHLYGEKAPVIYVDTLPKSLPLVEVRSMLQHEFESGAGSSGWNRALKKDDAEAAKSGNALWEGHAWVTVKEALGL
ncbi:NAD(P)-binding protein [Leucogyrophana mollusca]|uniref:NAD(P)-binding protein n=1 Tax=Leucogyrophana mollusca TaxID=85980 RepID=A0ACB8BSF8_9AGAM|nr:NAD(P)-binding protein [Leucogyrophana mollusca]